jgi:hypothetical protein
MRHDSTRDQDPCAATRPSITMSRPGQDPWDRHPPEGKHPPAVLDSESRRHMGGVFGAKGLGNPGIRVIESHEPGTRMEGV